MGGPSAGRSRRPSPARRSCSARSPSGPRPSSAVRGRTLGGEPFSVTRTFPDRDIHHLKGEREMFHQLFRLATLAKFATAATLIAGAYGTGNIDMPESRPLDSSLHAEKTPETAVVRQPEPTAKPEKTAQPATATTPVTSERYSFENLLK